MGTDFWLTFGKNREKTVLGVNLQIRVVATKATQVTYTFTQNGSKETREIAAGEVNTFVLSPAQRMLVYQPSQGGGTSNAFSSKLSLHIESTEPVSVFALNQSQCWTDATNLLPVNALGKDYYHISYAPSLYEDVSTNSKYDGYTIVATEDNTTVSANGTVLNTTPLAKGHVFHVYEYNTDMTGAHITANYPIVLFSSNVCAQVPIGINASDLLFQQMVPVQAWGKKYAVPASKQGIDRVRIVASQDGTNISQTGGTVKSGSLTNLGKGRFVELEITLADGGCYIVADKPVGVCSYLVGASYLGFIGATGDPSLACVPPVEQYVDSVTIAPFVPGKRYGVE